MRKIYQQLPEGWSEKNLKENCLFLRRGKSPVYCEENQGLLVINQDCIRWERIDLNKVKYNVVPNRIEDEFYLQSSDILINSTGTGTIGRVNQWTNQDINAVADSHITLLRLKKEAIVPEYVRYFLSSEHGQRYLESVCYTGSTNQIELSKRYLSKLNLPCAPYPEQKAIAGILTKINETIESIEKSIIAEEKLKKSLMQNMLTGKMKPDGTWRKQDEFYVDEKFGKVPIGWLVSKIKDYGTVCTGKTPPTAEPNVFAVDDEVKRFPFITPGDLGEKKYIDTSERYVTEKGISYSYKLSKNAVCVVCIGSTIGKIGIIKTEACTNQQINALIVNEENSYEFFYYMMIYRNLHFKEIAGVNATPQINKSGFNKYKILRPINKDEQIEIADKIATFDDEIMKKKNKIQTLVKLRKSVMQNLLTGKIRVNVEKINILLEGE